MKKIPIILLLVSNITLSQIHFFEENRTSIHIITDNVIFQKRTFYAGLEFQAEFSNGIYLRPQIHYAALTDGYIETSSGMGLNLSLNRWNNINAYSGIKLGVINRARTYPIFGIEAGIEVNITNTIAIGLRASYDSRGDASFYDGDKWRYNSQGYLKLIL